MAVPFTITDQQHEWQFLPNGGRVGRWIISFQTESGIESQVIVPDDSYSPQTVAQLVARDVDVIERVQNLSEGNPPPQRIDHRAT